jgi:hypothetical protein
MSLPSDLKFAAGLAVLGVIMLTVPPAAAAWLGLLLVLAAVSYAQRTAPAGHGFIDDLQKLFGGNNE